MKKVSDYFNPTELNKDGLLRPMSNVEAKVYEYQGKKTTIRTFHHFTQGIQGENFKFECDNEYRVINKDGCYESYVDINPGDKFIFARDIRGHWDDYSSFVYTDSVMINVNTENKHWLNRKPTTCESAGLLSEFIVERNKGKRGRKSDRVKSAFQITELLKQMKELNK